MLHSQILFYPILRKIIFYLRTLAFQRIFFLYKTRSHLCRSLIFHVLEKGMVSRFSPTILIYPTINIIFYICIFNPINNVEL